MKKLNMAMIVATATVSLMASAAYADTTVFNSTPTDTWYFGTGNAYTPANSAELTTLAGDQLSARWHNTFQAAPASVGNVYNFGLGPQQLSFDWGIDPHTGSFSGLRALITLTNLAGGSFSYDPLATGNDNSTMFGSQQNSFRANWVSVPLNFNPLIGSTYNFNLTVWGLDGGTKSLDVVAKLGNGGAVPEPATWALMLMGFGAIGITARRRRHAIA